MDSGWQPKANGKVNTLALSTDGGRVYVGGLFTTLNGQGANPYLGAVSAATGKNDSGFAPHSLFPVLKVVADSRGVYVGQAGSGGHLLLLKQDGTLQQPVYQLDGDVQAVAVDGDSVFGGGHFTNYCVGNTGAGAPFMCDKNLPRRKVLEVSCPADRSPPGRPPWTARSACSRPWSTPAPTTCGSAATSPRSPDSPSRTCAKFTARLTHASKSPRRRSDQGLFVRVGQRWKVRSPLPDDPPADAVTLIFSPAFGCLSTSSAEHVRPEFVTQGFWLTRKSASWASESVHVTMTPRTGLPLLSRTFAVYVWVPSGR